MAATTPVGAAVSGDTLIVIKIAVNDSLKKLKLPLRDLGANVLPDKLRQLLDIKPDQIVVFERFSDSAGGYVTLDSTNPQAFKTLLRAAKAKLKLRLKAIVTSPDSKQESEQEKIPDEKAEVPKTTEPVIVRSPVNEGNETAGNRSNIGSGIFQFREHQASQQTLVDTSEAPVPKPFTASNTGFFGNLANASMSSLPLRPLAAQPVQGIFTANGSPWSVYCNECDAPVADSHFHCSSCAGGDYDLCENCIAQGKHCSDENHWLIKRFIKDGQVISSKTARISPRKPTVEEPAATDAEKEMPGAFTDDTKTLAEEPRGPTRTCNCCVVVLPESQFVTCTTCADYDLCRECHEDNKHGHHPAHAFKPATDETTLSANAQDMLAAGRNVSHNAICDGCDKKIAGIRHKCQGCPDFDYCNDCIKDAHRTHERHRFVPIYEPLPDQHLWMVRHDGIFCDGPVCVNKPIQRYIIGVRYKCAVCHNTDFCATCEALPANHHNRTHPLIKFKTPVRSVSITTENADVSGNVRVMGDRHTVPSQTQADTKSAATETTPVQQANAATQVQTIAEIKPSEEKEESVAPQEEKKAELPAEPKAHVSASMLNAHFVHDTIPDGHVVQPGARFTQTWTVRNPGPYAWPAGCSVRYVGGDNMLNLDNSHPASVTAVAEATESNIVAREVQAGEEIAFRITLQAPTREGKSISYWRLKGADGTPFGHRLWCDINVKKHEEVKVEEKPAPAPQPPYNAPFNQLPQAQLSRMQAVRQHHHQMMHRQQQVALAQQQAYLQAQAQQREQQQHYARALGQPPGLGEAHPEMQARLHDMRAEQFRRREAMLAAFHAQRDSFPVRGMKREDVPGYNQHVNPVVGTEQAGPASAVPVQPQSTEGQTESSWLEGYRKQNLEELKAKIIKQREERSKHIDALKASKKEADDAARMMDDGVQEKVAAVPAVEEAPQVAETEAAKAENVDNEEDMNSSQMVFPKLEKESPTSSTYQSAASSTTARGKAAYVENEEGEVEHSAAPSAAPVPATLAEPSVAPPVAVEDDFEDLSAEIDDVSATAVESEDDGFLTDEEYDILDADDHETVASK